MRGLDSGRKGKSYSQGIPGGKASAQVAGENHCIQRHLLDSGRPEGCTAKEILKQKQKTTGGRVTRKESESGILETSFREGILCRSWKFVQASKSFL